MYVDSVWMGYRRFFSDGAIMLLVSMVSGTTSRLMDGEMEELCRTFNDNIEAGVIVEDWLNNYLVPLPKAGKEHTKIHIIIMQNKIRKLF